MKREQFLRVGLGTVLIFGLAGSALVGACSAGGGSKSLGSSGGGQGNPNGGVGNYGGGFVGEGGQFIPTLGNGGQGGAVGVFTDGGYLIASDGGVSDAHVGPSTVNNCANTAPFQNPSAGNRVVYPYDGTVFPRGLAGPLLMWDQQATQILIQAKSQLYTYTDCPQTPDGVRYQLPANMWAGAASWSNGTGDPLQIQLTVLSGGKATGPVTFSVKFALTTLKGAIYYNTYGSPQAGNGNGAVMRLIPGDTAPTVFLTDNGVAPLGPCRSCHGLSANGTTMTVNHHAYGFPSTYSSESYDVSTGTPNLLQSNIPEAGFAGIFPDGSRLMTNGPPNPSLSAIFPTSPGDVTALVQSTSKMLDVRTGQPITTTGWNVTHAQMPMFSPDGLHIVYNDEDKGPTTNITNPGTLTVGGHTLWVQDFDPNTNTFSNPRQIFSDPTWYAAWPFFTPDSTQVVFAVDSRPDFSSQVPDALGGNALTGIWPTVAQCITTPDPQTCVGNGHLMLVDLASGKVTPLNAANGYKSDGTTSYLPAGKGRDNEYEFFPTVSPFSGGGFAWVFFSSRRTYGNDVMDPSATNPGDPGMPTAKKIWVTAVQMGAPAGTDPSFPAFLLPGQELASGNIRAFAALAPCKEDGSSCQSGFDCCKGYCSNIKNGTGICGKVETQTCSLVDERCNTTADCCTGPNNGDNGRNLYCILTAGTGYCEEKGIN